MQEERVQSVVRGREGGREGGIYKPVVVHCVALPMSVETLLWWVCISYVFAASQLLDR